MYAEILAIGDEITSGQTLDTNSQWLSQRLEQLGIAVLFHTTVGDQLAAGTEVFRQAIERADLVVATGGLGPTADDLTRDALAAATQRPLQIDAESMEYIRRMFALRNRPMPPQNERQALFPAGSRVVLNPHGTAPGIDLEAPRVDRPACRVFCLPGVPAEMVEMWQGSVAPAIVAMLGPQRQIICRRRIHCFGAGESQIESMLPDLIRRGRVPEVGITASKATITLRVAAAGRTPAECETLMAPTLATIRQCLGTLVYGEEEDQLQDAVVRLLRQRGKTLATAEVGTGGLLAEWLAAADGPAGVFRGGLVLPEGERGEGDAGCGGRPTAIPRSPDEMAADCRRQFAADFGLAVGPLPAETAARQPPRVTLSLVSAAGAERKELPLGIHPDLRRIYVAKQALNLVRLRAWESE